MSNFLRNHITLIKLLDYARESGIPVGVKDDGGYWESRDHIHAPANEAATLSRFIGSTRLYVTELIERIVKDHAELGPPRRIKNIDRNLR